MSLIARQADVRFYNYFLPLKTASSLVYERQSSEPSERKRYTTLRSRDARHTETSLRRHAAKLKTSLRHAATIGHFDSPFHRGKICLPKDNSCKLSVCNHCKLSAFPALFLIRITSFTCQNIAWKCANLPGVQGFFSYLGNNCFSVGCFLSIHIANPWAGNVSSKGEGGVSGGFKVRRINNFKGGGKIVNSWRNKIMVYFFCQITST